MLLLLKSTSKNQIIISDDACTITTVDTGTVRQASSISVYTGVGTKGTAVFKKVLGIGS